MERSRSSPVAHDWNVCFVQFLVLVSSLDDSTVMYLIALTFALTFTSLAIGADVTVEVQADAKEINERLGLYGLFKGGGLVKGTVAADDKKVVFKVQQEGAFALVLWQRSVIWAPSPEYDKTIFIERNDLVVKLPNKMPIRQFKLVLPPAVVDRVEKDHGDQQFVPCRVQRVENKMAWPHAFRWVLLDRTKDRTGYTGGLEDTLGSFTVTIPQSVGTTVFPAKPEASTTLPHPLLVAPFEIEKEGKLSNPYRESGIYLEWKNE